MFRCFKSDLGFRPIFHRKEERADSHLFITVLAYQFVQLIRRRLKESGINANSSWRTLREIMSTQCRVSAIQRYFDELITELEKAEFKGGCLLGNLMGEIGDTSELCQKSLQSAVHRYRDLLQAGLLKAQQEGAVRTDKSAEDMADLLVNMWQGALLRMKIERSIAPLKQCCKDLLGDFFKA